MPTPPTVDGPTTDGPTIDAVLDAFLTDQRARLSARTMRSYEDVVDLLRNSLNGYGPNSLDEQDLERWKQAMHAGDDEAFCRLLGPEHLLAHLGEFLGYFMVRKVMAGEGLLRSAGTVTKKLAAWLHEHGYADEDERDRAVDRGGEAARDLPLQIERVEPGKLFFAGGIGPLRVSRQASDLARPGWEVTITLARRRGTWQVTEVGNVYPR